MLTVIVALICIDTLIFGLLDSAHPVHPKLAGLARYFDYGRSIEGKLRRTLASPNEAEKLVAKAGWLDPSEWTSLPSKPAHRDGLLMAVYGQSFAFNAARELQRTEPRFSLRLIGGPAAPLSHSFAAYRADAPLRRADVVVIGVLASSLAKSGHISMITSTFENPAPFTFPRFTLEKDRLLETQPAVLTYPQFVRSFTQRDELWNALVADLQRFSPAFDSFSFSASFTDNWATLRLVRRGWIASQGPTADELRDPSGLRRDFVDQIPVGIRLLREAQMIADRHNEPLVVLLLNDRGYHGALDSAFREALTAAHIPVVSSTDVFSARDPSSFLPDGHYAPTANHALATALGRKVTETIREERSRSTQRRPMDW